MEPLAGAIADFINKRLGKSDVYHSFCGRQLPGAEEGISLSELFKRTVSQTDSNPTMHLFVVLPLYEADAEEKLHAVLEEISHCEMPLTVCVIGLRGWLANAVENTPDAPSRADDAQDRVKIARLSGIVGSISAPASFCVLDDFLCNNAPINFDFARFTRFMGEFFTIVMSDYAAVFSPIVYQQAKSVMGIGLASVEFARSKFEDFLMVKAFASALNKAGVTQETVNLSQAQAAAAEALGNLPEYYPEFYTQHVEIPEKLGKSSSDINKEIDRVVEEERKKIARQLSSVVFAKDRPMPEREATLALILGKDNRFLRGMNPQLDCIFDDTFSKPLEVFLHASKDVRASHGLERDAVLPVRGDYPELSYPPKGEDDAGNPIPDPRNSECFNPLSDIKRLRLEMIELSGWIRRNSERLEKLKATQRARDEVHTVLNEEGELVVQGVRRKASGVEQPLSEKYIPRPGLTIPPSVDMRSFYGPAVNQGSLGACSTFATIALYEGVANRNGDGNRLKLSEAFLFYHSNVATGRVEEGSNFSEQFEILADKGACRSELFEYSDTDLDSEPDADAVADALEHRLLRALELPLERTGHKFDDMEKNHRLITSALAEGFPVGLSLRIPEKFGSEGPNIGRPTDEDISNDLLSNHAMTIVGYDEQAKFYIVRNSWGAEFGDQGYCYISAAYIDDPDLNNFCCIIERTTDTDASAENKPLPLVARISGTETEVEIRSISNALEYARIHLDACTTEFEASYRYFINLIDILSLPATRRNLLESLTQAVESKIDGLKQQENYMRSKIKENSKKNLHNYVFANSSVVFILAVVAFIAMWAMDYSLGNSLLVACLTMVGYGVFMSVFYLTYLQKKYDREYKESINELARRAFELCRYECSLQMKFYAAGAVLDMLKDIRQDLEDTYVRMSAFVSNLKLWHTEYENRSLELDLGDDPKFHTLGDRDVLLSYFEQIEGVIVATFDFMKAFHNFNVEPEKLAEVRTKLEDGAKNAVARFLGSAYLADHITGTPSAPYLPVVDLSATVSLLGKMAQPMLRHVGASQLESCIVIAAHDNLTSWGERIRNHFRVSPVVESTEDIDRISVISQIFLPPEDVI